MPSYATTAVSSLSLSNQHKTALVVGGTQGIGAGIARKFASLGCERIIILGRIEEKAQEVLGVLRGLAPQGVQMKAEFVRGDLSTIEGMKETARTLVATLGPNSVDYLVQTQNGVPTGVLNLNLDGLGPGFAVQALSRFLISYYLIKSHILRPSAVVLAVANPGNSLPSLTLEDLSLVELGKKCGKARLFMSQSMRDSMVLDGYIEEMHSRYPEYRFVHIGPGVVNTEKFDPNFAPFPFNWVFSVLRYTIGTTPDEFASAPVYLSICPDFKKEFGEERYFNSTMKSMPPGPWGKNEEKRKALWTKLCEMIGEED